jgi:hypothetical protein
LQVLDRHHINCPVFLPELLNYGEDFAVGRGIEIGVVELVGKQIAGLFLDQHTANCRHLRLHIVGRSHVGQSLILALRHRGIYYAASRPAWC